MRRYWLYLALMVAVITLMAALLDYSKPKSKRADPHYPMRGAPVVDGLRALLFVPDAHWNRNEGLKIYIALQNESKSRLVLDRRLDIGTTIRLTIEHKEGMVNYTPYGVTVSRPGPADLIVLNPGEFIGRQFVVSKDAAFSQKTRKAIDRMPSGTAKMRAYYTTLNQVWDSSSGKPSWWTGEVASNEIDIEVK